MRTTTVSDSFLRYRKKSENVRELVRLEYPLFQFSQVILYLLLIFLAFRAAYLLRFEAGFSFFNENVIPAFPFFVKVMLVSIAMWVINLLAGRVHMGMLNIRSWSIWLDIQFLVQTIPAVLSRKGAYLMGHDEQYCQGNSYITVGFTCFKIKLLWR